MQGIFFPLTPLNCSSSFQHLKVSPEPYARNLIFPRLFVKSFSNDKMFLTSHFSSAIFISSPAFVGGKIRLSGDDDRDNSGELCMSRKIYLVVSLMLVSGVAAAWYFLAPSKPSSTETNNDTPDLGAEAPISVKVQYARQGTLVLRLTANGYTRASRQVPLTAQVGGVVDSLLVFERV